MNEIFKTLVEFTSEGMIYQETECDVTYWNSSAKKIFRVKEGQSYANLNEIKTWRLLYEDGTECADDQRPTMLTLRTGKALRGEIRGVVWDGGPITWLSVNTQPVFEPGRELPSAVVTSFRDITHQKKQEANLKQAADIFAHIPVGLCIYRYEPPERLILTQANSEADRIIGRDSTQLLGGEFNQVWPGAEKVGLTLRLREVMRSGKAYQNDSLAYSDENIQGYFRLNCFKLSSEYLAVAFEDITSLRRAEVALSESEERYRSLVQLSPDGLYVSRGGTILYANPEAVRIWGGQSLDDLVGRCVWDFFPPDQIRFAKERHRSMVEQGVTVPLAEFRISRIGGGNIDVEATSCPVPFPGGVAVQTTIRDISKRKAAEKALQEQIKLVDSIIRSSQEGIVVMDRELRVKVWNPFMERLTGKMADEVLGNYPWDDFPLLKEIGVVQRLRMALSGHPQPSAELPYDFSELEKSGWLLETSSPLFSNQGEIIGVISTVLEITEQVTARQELEEQKIHLERLFHSSPEAIMMSDTKAMITRINPGFTRLFGFSESECLGKDSIELLDYDQASTTMAERFGVVIAGHEAAYETKRRKKNGAVVDVSVLSAPIKVEGQVVGIYSIYRDITEQAKAAKEKQSLEIQLQQAQKLEAIGTLAGGIAHDFNNMLAAITGYSELALRDCQAGRAPVDEIERILKVTGHARDLVKQILGFSRNQSPGQEYLDLNRIVLETRELIQRTFPKMIKVELDLDGSSAAIRGDRIRIEQILLNLATNARDAMAEGGAIRIETSVVYLDDKLASRRLDVKPGPYVRLRVSDTGSGMQPETMERIFEPFFTTKESGKGTGLGLATVYSIVRSHGGHIECTSGTGKGTRFTIHLPAIPHEVQADAASADFSPLPQTKAGETILLVDDEPDLRKIGSKLLRLSGYSVISASSGEQALRVYREKGGGIDLVIMDLSMPGMGGQKALEKIKAVDPNAKVVIASGYTAEKQFQDLMKAGASGYLRKPFRTEQLLEMVREHLNSD